MRARTNIDSNFVKAKPLLSMLSSVGSSELGYIKLTVQFQEDKRRRGYKIMVKTDGYPQNSNDGSIFYDSKDGTHKTEQHSIDVTIKNNASYVDGTTYYFAAFPYTYKNATKVYTEKNAVKCTATPYQTQGEIIFTESGIFTVPYKVTNIQVFLVGGGAGGTTSNGGGGGYTATYNLSVTNGEQYVVVIGAGGNANANGGQTSFGDFSVSGGTGSNGGSGGGQSVSAHEDVYGTTVHGQRGGSDGTNGYEYYTYAADSSNIGFASRVSTNTTTRLGQQTTTRAFGESTGTLYAGGGGGAGTSNMLNGNDYNGYGYQGGAGGEGGGGRGADYPVTASGYEVVAATDATENSGGGGGAGNSKSSPGKGGSGIAIIRWGYE